MLFRSTGCHGAASPARCGARAGGPAQGGVDTQEKCDPDPFTIVSDDSEYWDQQEIKLQELPEDVPLGDMPVLNSRLYLVAKFFFLHGTTTTPI